MINLDRFTAGEDELREYLMSPIRMGIGVVATNGHILIVQPELEGDYNEHTAAFEKSVERVLSIAGGGKEVKLPSLESLPDAIMCETCDGTGEMLDEFEEEDACLNCRNGITPQSVALGHSNFDLEYIRLIVQELPSPKFTVSGRDAKGGAYIDFDGGYGALMPLMGKSDIHHIVDAGGRVHAEVD